MPSRYPALTLCAAPIVPRGVPAAPRPWALTVRHAHAWCPDANPTGESATGPCVCTRAAFTKARSTPPTPAYGPRETGGYAERAGLAASPDPKRRADVTKAMDLLASVGREWADAKAWAETTGRWSVADLKALNARAVEAYVASLGVHVG